MAHRPSIRRWLATLAAGLAGMAALAGLSGCAGPAGPISLSVSELGSEVQEDAGSLFYGIRHRRSHNVTGLGSTETVGMLSADPDPPLLFRWPSLFTRPTLPDQLSPRISSECSRVAVHDLPMAEGKGMPEVLALRDSLEALHGAEVALQRARAQALLLGEIVASHEAAAATAVPAEAASSAARPEAASSAARPDAAAAQRALLVDAWRRLAPGADVPADAAGWKAERDKRAEEIAALQGERERAHSALRAARKEQGLVVARWEYEASRQGALAAVGATASARSASTRAGFVVMGHPRTVTLISGDDLMARACSAKDAKCDGAQADTRTGIDTMIPARRLYTTTFQLLAQHLAWAETGAVEQQAAFKAQLSEIARTLAAPGLASLKDKLLALDVEVGYAAASMTSGENLGAVSGSRQWEVPFTFWDDTGYARSVAYLRALNGRFLRVSSMRSTLDAYASRYGGKLPAAVADRCQNLGPTREDVERAQRVHLACDAVEAPGALAVFDAADLAHRRESCQRVGPPRPVARTAALDAP